MHVINVAENEKKTAFVKKAVFKLERKLTGTQPFRRGAIRYLQNQYYDAAISYGEWFSSALCARYAAARRKYVWIHADMDKGPPFSTRTFCALKRSSTAFLRLPPLDGGGGEKISQLLASRSAVLPEPRGQREDHRHERGITARLSAGGRSAALVTVANVREEKNHLRQVAAMQRLFS